MSEAARIASSGVVTALFSLPVAAQSWSILPQVRVGTDYNDNLQLLPDNPDATKGAIADLSADLKRTHDALEIELAPKLVLARYQPLSAYNRHDPSVNLATTYTWPTAQSSLGFGWISDSTLTSELGTTGLTQVNRRHEGLTLTGAQAWRASELLLYSAQLSGSRNRYSDAAGTGLVDYEYISAALQLEYTITQRSTLSLALTDARLTVPAGNFPGRTNQYAELKYTAAPAELWKVELSVGPSRVILLGQAESGLVYNASAVRSGERLVVNLAASQNVAPNGYGLLAKRRELSASCYWPLSERVSAGGTLRKISNQTLLAEFGFEFYREDYTAADFIGRWRLTPTYSLELSAGRAQQRATADARLAVGNHAAFSLKWTGLERTLH